MKNRQSRKRNIKMRRYLVELEATTEVVTSILIDAENEEDAKLLACRDILPTACWTMFSTPLTDDYRITKITDEGEI